MQRHKMTIVYITSNAIFEVRPTTQTPSSSLPSFTNLRALGPFETQQIGLVNSFYIHMPIAFFYPWHIHNQNALLPCHCGRSFAATQVLSSTASKDQRPTVLVTNVLGFFVHPDCSQTALYSFTCVDCD